MLTPKQRLNAYYRMLPFFEAEERVRAKYGSYHVRGLCAAVNEVSFRKYGATDDDISNHIETSLPELLSVRHLFITYHPKISRFWFERIEEGRDDNRCNVLYAAIEKVLPLCE